MRSLLIAVGILVVPAVAVAAYLLLGWGATPEPICEDLPVAGGRRTCHPVKGPPPSSPNDGASLVVGGPTVADLDGDGEPDEVTASRSPGGHLELSATLSSEGMASLTADHPVSGRVAVAGAADIDGDGRQEQVVNVGGETVANFLIVQLSAGDLRLVTDGDNPYVVAIGSANSGTATASCDDGRVTEHHYDRIEGTLRTVVWRLTSDGRVEVLEEDVLDVGSDLAEYASPALRCEQLVVHGW